MNEFSYLIPSTATSIVFTAEAMPTSAVLIDVDADGDGGVVAWMDGTTMKVSTQISGQKIIAPSFRMHVFRIKQSIKHKSVKS